MQFAEIVKLKYLTAPSIESFNFFLFVNLKSLHFKL